MASQLRLKARAYNQMLVVHSASRLSVITRLLSGSNVVAAAFNQVAPLGMQLAMSLTESLASNSPAPTNVHAG